jgi:hypothetical protein
MPDEAEFLCGDWVWDSVLREMRHYPRLKKDTHAEEPDAVERLEATRSVTVYQWSQQPMQTATGEIMTPQQTRVVAEYADGRKLEINEANRTCARKIADTIAAAYGLPVSVQGTPTGRSGGNLPKRDDMGRLANTSGRVETKLDETAGILEIKRRKRFIGSERRELRTTEIRRLDHTVDLKGPTETFTVWAIVGPDEERIPIASYSGFEGWSDPEEWRDFTEDLARSLGVEARLPAPEIQSS